MWFRLQFDFMFKVEYHLDYTNQRILWSAVFSLTFFSSRRRTGYKTVAFYFLAEDKCIGCFSHVTRSYQEPPDWLSRDLMVIWLNIYYTSSIQISNTSQAFCRDVVDVVGVEVTAHDSFFMWKFLEFQCHAFCNALGVRALTKERHLISVNAE